MANIDLTNTKVQFGYTIIGSTDTYNSTGATPGEIVFVQYDGQNDGVIFINDKQFSVRKSDFDKLKTTVDSIAGEGNTINLSELNDAIQSIETKNTEQDQAIATTASSVAGIIASIGGNYSENNTVASAIQEAKDNVKSITVNSTQLTNTAGNWAGTINAENIEVGTINSTIGGGVNNGSTIQEALETISGRIDTLIDGDNLNTAFDTIKEISDYLADNSTAITDLTNLQSRVGTAESRITTAESDIDALEGKFTNMQTTAAVDNGKYITGVSVDSTGLIQLSSATLNSTAVSRLATEAASDQIALTSTTIEGALIELARGVKTASESGVTSLSTHGLVTDVTGTTGVVNLLLSGTSILLGTTGENGGLISLNDASTIGENISSLNIAASTQIASTNAALFTATSNIASLTATVNQLINEHLTWQMITNSSETPTQP